METSERNIEANMNELIGRIEAKYEKMSKGQKRLAEYVKENYDKAVFLTAARLGEIVGVSESTVVRFATQLGYRGYPEFQKALEELVRNKLNSIQRMEVTYGRITQSEILETVLQSDIEKINQFIGELVDMRGALDGVVYCVGPQCVRPLKMLKPEIVRQTMEIGFGAYIELVRSVVKKGNYNQPMSIVSISSIAAQIGNPAKTVYAAMKAATDAAIRCLAVELAPKGIRLNSVKPGMVATKRLEELQNLVGSSQQLKETEARQYLGISEATDIANTICFLLSEDAKTISGTSMDVSGGFMTS